MPTPRIGEVAGWTAVVTAVAIVGIIRIGRALFSHLITQPSSIQVVGDGDGGGDGGGGGDGRGGGGDGGGGDGFGGGGDGDGGGGDGKPATDAPAWTMS